MRNTNATIEESIEVLDDIQNICVQRGKSLVVYLSMGFGNPYGDEWNVEICAKWVEEMHKKAFTSLPCLTPSALPTQKV